MSTNLHASDLYPNQQSMFIISIVGATSKTYINSQNSILQFCKYKIFLVPNIVLSSCGGCSPATAHSCQCCCDTARDCHGHRCGSGGRRWLCLTRTCDRRDSSDWCVTFWSLRLHPHLLTEVSKRTQSHMHTWCVIDKIVIKGLTSYISLH